MLLNRADIFPRAAAWVVLVTVWLLLYLPRTWSLGFYHDDWYLLRRLPTAEMADLIAQFPSRPAFLAIHLVATTALGSDAFAWQATMMIFSLISAVAIGQLCARLAIVVDGRSAAPPELCPLTAALWLSLPWSLGYTAFPTTFNGLVAMIAFAGFGIVVLSEMEFRRKVVWASALLIFQGLIFEAFLGASILLVAMITVLHWLKQKKLDPNDLRMILVVGFVQIGLVLYNRVWAIFGVGQNKLPDFTVFSIFRQSFMRLPEILSSAIPFGLYFALAGIGACLVAAFARCWWRPGIALLIVFAACLIGIAGTSLVYALGGYGLAVIGLSSRTTVAVSFWLVLGLSAVAAIGLSGRVASRWVVFLAMTLIIAVMGQAQWRNLQDWQAAWTFQKALLREFPAADYAAKAKPGDLLLVDFEPPAISVDGLAAFWDISGALFAWFSEVRSIQNRPVSTADKTVLAIATMANPGKFANAWDGRSLTQKWCTSGVAVWSLGTPGSLLIWRQGHREITVAKEPFELGCEPKRTGAAG